jgi:ribosomal protein S18 acetylase RimI-like enzyme
MLNTKIRCRRSRRARFSKLKPRPLTAPGNSDDRGRLRIDTKMTTVQSPFDLNRDLADALALADISPQSIPHAADWPYRFSSWALDDPLNVRVWRDSTNRMVGWAALQTPFWAIDCVAHADAPAPLYRQMLGWAKSRATDLHRTGGGRPMWFVSIAASCDQQRRDLAELGFENQAAVGEDSWSKVLFELTDAEPPPQTLPSGLQIRSLNPASEIQAYVDMHREVFQSESMTHDWRARATRMADYRNDLDLVLVSGDGVLCGFCVAWLRQQTNGERIGQIEPLGVREAFRGNKLSRALMSDAIRRLRALGAQRIYVETDRQRDAAMAAYEAQGFRIAREVLVYRYVLPAQAN